MVSAPRRLFILFLVLASFITGISGAATAEEQLIIREIVISGNRMVEEATVRARIESREGDVFEPEKVTSDVRAIYELGFFEDISLEPRTTDFEDQLDLDVRVIERPTGSLSFGAGFSSLDKFVISGSVSQSNLFGRGYGLALSADIGGRSNRFFLSFTDPYFMGSSFGLAASIFSTDLEFEDFDQEQTGLDLSLSHHGRFVAFACQPGGSA